MGTGFSKKKKEAKQMQQQFSKMQEKMMTMEATGSAGNGLVTITLTGEGDLKAIKINPECVDKEDIEGLELLIKAAFTDAQKKLKEQSSSEMPGIPPRTFWIEKLQEKPIICVKKICRFLCKGFSDWTFRSFHFRNLTLSYSLALSPSVTESNLLLCEIPLNELPILTDHQKHL